MKLLSTNICLSSPKSILVISVILFSSIVLAGVWPEKVIEVDSQEEPWVPTEADIAYQDSMYTIIQSTQNDITDIKKDIVYILERLDYEDGTYDSIRYVKGGKIDLRRN
jgi:hypothetical protein|tara:strand:- start:624 stop:950 length:327 start_codon:yes stop_codon:yes gene_type:complete